MADISHNIYVDHVVRERRGRDAIYGVSLYLQYEAKSGM